MTTASTTELGALREDLAFAMALRAARAPSISVCDPMPEWRRLGHQSAEDAARSWVLKYLPTADALLAGPLAPILAERDRLTAQVEAMRAALKPFADAAEAFPVSGSPLRESRRRVEIVWSYGAEDQGNRLEITVADIRAARSALGLPEPEGERP